MRTDLAMLKEACTELEFVFADSVKYPQLRLPEVQHARVKDLLFDLREHLAKHPFVRKKS